MSRRTNAQIIAELRDSVMRGEPFSCTFVDGIPQSAKAAVEKRLEEKFRIWRNTWIIPRIDEIEQRLIKPKKGVPRG